MAKSPYNISGTPVPRTTTILNILNKEGLKFWAANLAVEHINRTVIPGVAYTDKLLDTIFADARKAHITARDSAGEFGTHIHKLIEAYVKGKEVEWVSDDEKNIIDDFKRLTKGWKWLASEVAVKHYGYKYGGTCDGVAILPTGEHAIIDFKTSNSVYAEAHMQLTMYSEATPQKKYQDIWKKITVGRILHLDKETLKWNDPIVVDLDFHKPYIKHFVKMYGWRNHKNNK